MSFARIHKFVTYLIASLGLYAITLGGDLGLITMILMAAFTVASAAAEEPLIARPGYSRAWTIFVLVVLGLQVIRGFLGATILPLGLEFVAFLQISRLFNRRTARDHQQIAVLAFAQLIAATVITSGMAYGLVFVGFLVVTPWMLALSHLRREIEGNYPGVIQRRAPDVQRILGSKRVVGPRFLLGTALLTLPIFACTFALFLLFPRVGLGVLSFGRANGQYTAGFGSDVELGGFGTIRDNPQVVLRFIPEAIVSNPDPPQQASMRFRGTSFDQYNGVRWSRALEESRNTRMFESYYPVTRWPRDGDASVKVVLDYLDEPVLFLPPNTVGITLEGRVASGAMAFQSIRRTTGLDLRYTDDLDVGISYTAHVSDGLTAAAEELSAEELAAYTDLPELPARLHTLASQLTESATTDREKASAILAYLSTSGEYTYSLNLPDTEGRDPLDVFLFEAKAGHCEYFSTAMAVLLRSVNVPTRNVTGFVGGVYNPYGRYYAITQGDAHSWIEVYLDGAWVTFDPTPSGEGFAARTGLLHELRALLDAAQVRWMRDVVGYDLRHQAEGARALLSWLRGMQGDGSGEPTNRGVQSDASSYVPPWYFILGGIVVILLILAYRFRRGRKSLMSATERHAQGLYETLERRLTRVGQPRPSNRTALEHLRHLEDSEFPHAKVVRTVTEEYLGARFGAISISSERLRALKEQIQTIEASESPDQRSFPGGP